MGRDSCLRRIVGRIGLSMWAWIEKKHINMDMVVASLEAEEGEGTLYEG